VTGRDGDAPPRLFVYGTLAPGDDAWPVLAPWTIGAPRADAVRGRLYDTRRGYPAAVFGHAGGLVHGYVVDLDRDRAPAALAALDRYEGPDYERVVVRTEARVTACAYAWTAPLAGCVPLHRGRWPAPS
jgi:gamma-glutamylcyclotransferase (GGCT)/AIG2-like uncharacterized protein YtfP